MNSLKLPKTAVLELTYRCNHSCLFCSCPWYCKSSNYPKKKELDSGKWIEIIDKLSSLGVKSFAISGGEALLYEGLPDVIRHLHQLYLRQKRSDGIVLISNGLLMSSSYLELFKENNIHLSMSLPGITNFKKLTGVDNAQGVLLWFKKAEEIGLQTTCNITVTKLNYDELYETEAVALLNGASSLLINRFLPGGRGLSNQKELMLTNTEINGMLQTTEKVLRTANRYGHTGTEIPLCIIKSPEQYKHLSIGYQCAAAKEFFVIDPAGQIRVCNHSPKVIGNILDEKIIQELDYWNLYSQSLYKPQFCNSCSKQSKCDCGCREVANIINGSPKEIDCSVSVKRIKKG